MTSISTQPTAILPVTAGVPETPPGPSDDAPVTFAAVIAPLAAVPARQRGNLPGNILPVKPTIDPKPDDRSIEAVAAGSDPEGSSDSDEAPLPAYGQNLRGIDPLFGWFAPTIGVPANFAAPVNPQRPPAITAADGAVPGITPGQPTPSTLQAGSIPVIAHFDAQFATQAQAATMILKADRTDTPVSAGQTAPSPAHPVLPQRPAGVTDVAVIALTLPQGRDVSPVQPHPRIGTAPLDETAPASAATFTPSAITAVATPDQAPLDLNRHGWPQSLIDRIETLRDNADAADTRIRIVPDALGAIDVAVRREGAVTHIHFAAEQAQTRHILADAQPRLAELAESRGLKLGGSSVGDGNGQQARHQSAISVARAPARTRIAATTTAHRIA